MAVPWICEVFDYEQDPLYPDFVYDDSGEEDDYEPHPDIDYIDDDEGDGFDEEDEYEPQPGIDYTDDDDYEMIVPESYGGSDDISGVNVAELCDFEIDEYVGDGDGDSDDDGDDDDDDDDGDDGDDDGDDGDDDGDGDDAEKEQTLGNNIPLLKRKKLSGFYDLPCDSVSPDDEDEKDTTLGDDRPVLKRRKISVVRDFPHGCVRPIDRTSSLNQVQKKTAEEEYEGRRTVLGLRADLQLYNNSQLESDSGLQVPNLLKKRNISAVRDFPVGCQTPKTQKDDAGTIV